MLMKNFSLKILVVAMFNALWANCNVYKPLIQKNGEPSETLIKLFDATKIEYEKTATGMNKVAQSNFLRKDNEERWQIQSDKWEKDREIIVPILDDLGMTKCVRPTKQEYNHVIIFGAKVDRMRLRLEQLISHFKEDLKFEKIYFLVGQRELDSKNENEDVLYNPNKSLVLFKKGWQRPENKPQTEAQAAEMIWNQTEMPEELEKKCVEFISVSMITNTETGETRRPNTEDTVKKWLSNVSKLENVMAVSNQPFVLYQHETLVGAISRAGRLSDDVTIETVGKEAKIDTQISVHLDNVARTLYTEVQNLNL